MDIVERDDSVVEGCAAKAEVVTYRIGLLVMNLCLLAW